MAPRSAGKIPFSSVHSVSSRLINSLWGHSVPSFSEKCWEGFSGWNFTKTEKFLCKGNGNWLLFRAEVKIHCPDPARDHETSSLSVGAAEPLPRHAAAWGTFAAGGTGRPCSTLSGPLVLDDIFLGAMHLTKLKITKTRQNNTDIWKAMDSSV